MLADRLGAGVLYRMPAAYSRRSVSRTMGRFSCVGAGDIKITTKADNLQCLSLALRGYRSF